LRDLTIIDTPALTGLGSTEDPVAAKLAQEADAVVYLSRYPEPEQLREFPVSKQSALAQQLMVQSILVLSRADEMGAGRIDALLSAKQLARRSWRESEFCTDFQSVIAVSGKIGYAAKALTDDDFSALCLLASVERSALENFLVSVDSFVEEQFPVEVNLGYRRLLLAKFGLSGIRLATTLLRTGSDTRIKLTAQLAQRSGLSELREALIMYFADRKEVLKMRSGLLALDLILRTEPRSHSYHLVDRIEQIVANIHDFKELRLISDLAGGRIILPDPLSEEALRLCGASGVSANNRLGLSDVDKHENDAEVNEIASAALQRWRQIAEHPDSAPSLRASARVVVRSCEGILVNF